MLTDKTTSNHHIKKPKRILVARKPVVSKKYAGYAAKYNRPDGYVCVCCDPYKIYPDRSNYAKHQKTSKHKKRQEEFEQKQKEIEIAVQTNIALAQLKMNITTESVAVDEYAPPPKKKEMFSVVAENISDCPLPELQCGNLEHNLPHYCQQHWRKLRQELRPIVLVKDILWVREEGMWHDGLKATELLNEFGRCYAIKTRHMMREQMDLDPDEDSERKVEIYLHNVRKLTCAITSKELLWKCQTAFNFHD